MCVCAEIERDRLRKWRETELTHTSPRVSGADCCLGGKGERVRVCICGACICVDTCVRVCVCVESDGERERGGEREGEKERL